MTNNKKQTAVEWLEQQIKLRGITHYFSIRELIEQAKEMEKQQIIEAFDFGDYCVDLPEGGWSGACEPVYWVLSEQPGEG